MFNNILPLKNTLESKYHQNTVAYLNHTNIDNHNLHTLDQSICISLKLDKHDVASHLK